MGQVVVETKDLTKNYGDFTAVNKLNLRIEEGDIFGFLGPNGAGKTTTILMLLGLSEPTSGNATVCGFNPSREPLKVKHIVGYMPERVGFYGYLTASQNLMYTADLNGLPKKESLKEIIELLDLVGLSEVGDKPVSAFSQGMKQRLGIADILIKKPKLVFLDEPTSGIDPNGITEILNLIVKMAKQKISVIFCSHQLNHVQKICTRVGILARGQLVAEGPIERLGKQSMGQELYQIEVQVEEADDKLIKLIKQIKGVTGITASTNSLLISCDTDLRSQIAKTIVESGRSLIGIKVEEFSLEKIYKKFSRGV
jgi:ABC-2 type transport system ATP-binding protein